MYYLLSSNRKDAGFALDAYSLDYQVSYPMFIKLPRAKIREKKFFYLLSFFHFLFIFIFSQNHSFFPYSHTELNSEMLSRLEVMLNFSNLMGLV